MLLIKTALDKARRLKVLAQHGAPTRRITAGSWLADMAALGKAVVLCESCAKKWNPGVHGYEQRRLTADSPTVRGMCDGCKRYGIGHLYMPKQRK